MLYTAVFFNDKQHIYKDFKSLKSCWQIKNFNRDGMII